MLFRSLISDGPVGSVQNLFKAVKNGDWKGIGKFVAESVYNGMSADQKAWTGKTITGWLTALNDAYATGGWQSVYQLGSSIASTLSATLSQHSDSILAAGSQWLTGIGGKISAYLPVLGDMASLLGKSLFSGITAFFPQLFAAIGSVVGTIGTALSGVISAVIATLSAIPAAGWALAAVAAAGLVALLVTLAKTQSDLNSRGASTTVSTPSTTTPSPSADAPSTPTPSTDPGGSGGKSDNNPQPSDDDEPTPGVTVVQYIYTNTDATASDLMREAIWEAERGVLVGL